MSNKAYNTILVLLILIIIGGAYVIFTHKEYTEDMQVQEPVSMQVDTTPKPQEQTQPEPMPETAAPIAEAPKPQIKAEAIASTFATETIEYTTLGFSPRQLTVKVGTRVTFVNQNDTQMWVASSPYPTHSNYPSFDQRRAGGNGSMYSFTFTAPGAYNYQNDKNPSHTGTIIVTE